MILLDTHVWFWWVETPSALPASLQAAIETAETEAGIIVSVASVWELALKTAAGRLHLSTDVTSWVGQASEYPGVVVENISAPDTIASTRLPGPLHKDPFDRLLIALARRLGVPLATVDQKLIDYPHVQTVG